MRNDRTAMLTSNHRVNPRRQNRRVTRAMRFVSLGLVALFVFVIGVTLRAQDSAKQQGTDSKKVSGFLGDYSALVPDPKNSELLVYEKDPSVLSRYNKFIFDPITIYLLPEAENRGIDADDLDRLAKYFEDAVADELTKSGKYQMVTTPGPGVLILRVAITNVEPTGGKKNAVVKGAATAASVTVAPGVGLAVPRLSVGKVGIEGEMVDSESGERMAAFVTSKAGRRWFSGLNTFKTWGDIEAAFRTWAKNFRKRLDQAHAS
jgi:hypothetical protein